ncbi:MAG: histidine phosphatase family protein, partial [Gallionellaceae bacterium]|nr:histidine phosphatase family protein [Gallionellaceae bacterium]
MDKKPKGHAMASAQINYLVLIRHGQSEGNVAQSLIRSGRIDEVPPAFFDVPNREYRLTPTGVAQCQPTGEYLGRVYPDCFRRIVTADFVRSTETMVHTLTAAGWTDAEVTTEALYGERIWGTMPREQQALLAEMEIRKRDPMNWRTPGGEMLTFTR